jgi:hypothetical protein
MKCKLGLTAISSLFLALILPIAAPRAHAAAQVTIFHISGNAVLASYTGRIAVKSRLRAVPRP